MIDNTDKKAHNRVILGFPSIYRGRGVKVTVALNSGHYNVHIDDTLIAKIGFDENTHTWYLMQGDLNDPDLVQEIGERIEAKYN